MLFKGNFGDLRPKIRGGGGGWTNSQENSHKDGQLSVLQFLSEYFNLAKFHPNRRDGMYHACLVLSWTQS